MALQELNPFAESGIDVVGQHTLYHNSGTWRATGILLHHCLVPLVTDWGSSPRATWVDLSLPSGMLRCLSFHFPHSWTDWDHRQVTPTPTYMQDL
eukprot:3591476-Amphidinium_carterae.1